MKTTCRLSIILLLIMIASSCVSNRKLTGPQYVIAPLSDTTKINEGTLIYSLPMTIFTVSIEMDRTINLPGPYAKYAEELLGLKNVIINEDEQWTIRSVSVSSHEEAA